MSQTSSPPSLKNDLPPPGAGPFYEVVDGRVVEPPEMGTLELLFANVLSTAVDRFFFTSGELGRTVVEMIFRLDPESRSQRRPDFAFVSYDRWPRNRPITSSAAWEVVPDLAVEVISPNELAVEVLEKIDNYFRFGVRQVWIVYPKHRRVFVHHSPKSITALDDTDTLDGGEVLPGFRLGLADLFDKAAGTAP